MPSLVELYYTPGLKDLRLFIVNATNELELTWLGKNSYATKEEHVRNAAGKASGALVAGQSKLPVHRSSISVY